MRLSVIIPFYNLERYVRPCLDSVLAALRACATPVGLEVICVDDGSTDGSGAILDAYPALDPQHPTLSFRVIHKPNGGEGSARNAGLTAATGDWVAFLDGDDAWLPNFLVCAVQAVAETPDADLVAFRFLPFADGAALPAPEPARGAVKAFDLRARIPSAAVREIGVFPTLFRRALLDGLSFSALPLGADRLYVAQCLAVARKAVLSDAGVEAYRVRPGSMANAVWDVRKVNSQCDYAFGALAALARSGRRVGRSGAAHLASLCLSDVPVRIGRLTDAASRAVAGRHWCAALDREDVVGLLSARFRLARRLYRLCGLSASLFWARVLRRIGVV